MIVLVILGAVVLLFGFVVFFGAPYVPSLHKDTEQAFENLYKISSHDVLLDVGSGDGVVLRIAARKGAKAVGYELNPLLVVVSRILARGNPRITTLAANFWLKPFPDDTTVVYAFSVTRDSARMVKKVQKEADRIGRALFVVTYGEGLPHITPVAEYRAHRLYRIEPLQQDKA